MISQTKMSCAIVAILVIDCSMAFAQTPQVVHEAEHAVTEERLCDALANIRDGEQRTVTVSGIFGVGYENAIFYDPTEAICSADVQPETWVEFEPSVRNDKLNRLLKRTNGDWSQRRAYVRFTGQLYGPGAIGPDDPSLLPPLAYMNRIRNRRYGHLSGYRTKLVVTGVSDVKSVPETVPWPTGRSAPSMPLVEHAEVPRYPEMACNVGITGNVILDVTVSSGQVSKADVRSGDRMLSDEAVRNVKTWHFAPDINTTFTTTFTYDVEHRQTGMSRAPRIELQLPAIVHITAMSNDW